MANECLVTKLKGVVDNDNLPIYNGFKFEALEETNFVKKRILFLGTEEIKLSIVSGNGYMSPYNTSEQHTEMTILPNVQTAIDFSNGNYTILLTGKYGLKKFSIISDTDIPNSKFKTDIENFKYCSDLTMITGSNSKLYGNIEAFKGKENLDTIAFSNVTDIEGNWKNLKDLPLLTRCILYNTNVYGNLSDFPNCITEFETNGNVSKISGTLAQLGSHTNLSAFGLIGNSNTSGNVEDLGALTSLTRFFISDKQDYSMFTGSVEGFVAAQIANGRSTVSANSPIYCPWFLHLATFGGSKRNVSGRMWLTWDNANKIVIYNGGTSIATSTTVYAKGATAQEISNWENAGKTVVVIS